MTVDRRKLLGLLAGAPAAVPVVAQALETGLKTGDPIEPGPADLWKPLEPEAEVRDKILHPVFGVQAEVNGQFKALRVRYYDTDPAAEPKPGASPMDIAKFYSENPEEAAKAAAKMAVHPARVGGRLSVQIMDYTPEGDSYVSFNDAEDKLFAQFIKPNGSGEGVFDYQAWGEIDRGSKFVGDWVAALPILINRQANLIAARTRRGAGNAVLMREDDFDRTFGRPDFHVTSAYKAIEQDKHIGRWRERGTLNSTITLYTTNNPPPSFRSGYVMVGYRGKGLIVGHNEYDAGGYIVSALGHHFPVVLPNSESTLGNGEDYFGAVRINYGEVGAAS